MTASSLAYLLDRTSLVEARIRTLVEHRRGHDPAPDDPFRGLYLSDDMAQRLLTDVPPPPLPEPRRRASIESRADTAEAGGAQIRLRQLARSAGFTDTDVELLVISLLPDLDSRFERLYGYLNDDVTRRRATIGLALELADLGPASATARSRLAAGAPLVDHGLILVEDPDRPFLTRGLRVPDRVTAHLLGDDTPDPDLCDLLCVVPGYHSDQSDDIAHALRTGERRIYIRESSGCAGAALGVAALETVHRPALCIDGFSMAAEQFGPDIVGTIAREALLRNAGVVLGPIDGFGGRTREVVRALMRLPVPLVVTGVATWDPLWSDALPLQIDARRLSAAERTFLWDHETASYAAGLELSDIAAQFILGPAQIARAARAAAAATALADGRLSAELLGRGARAQNAAGLERLTRRVEPAVSWPDLVLPAGVLAQLRELTARARYRDRVLSDWRMRPGGGRGIGVTALFAGDSGTGKTMAAEVIAAELGLDLYSVDLAAVVDKYVGETEKNLERIFAEAGGVNAVLLFDEADAIFGKRSEVRDAHDRYANIESAFLLQRMETFDGLAILATNLRANLDDAFTRRLDSIVDFPVPDEAARLALWRHCIAPPAPCGNDIDWAHLARAFTLSGGNIRSAAITAAYLAAAGGEAIGMAHLMAAIRQEFRKLGRLMPDITLAQRTG